MTASQPTAPARHPARHPAMSVRVVGLVVLIAIAMIAALAGPARASGTNTLFWIASYTGGNNQVWTAPGAMPVTPTVVTGNTAADYTYRSLATDGTYLYFADDSNSKLVRTDLDGTNRIVITSVTGSPEAIAYSGGYVYWTQYTSGVYRAPASAGASPTQVVVPGSNGAPNSFGYSALTVTGSDLFFGIYLGSSGNTNQALYRTTTTGGAVSKNPDSTGYYDFGSANLATDGTYLYLSGNGQASPARHGVLKAALADWNTALSSWTLLDTSAVTQRTKGITVLGDAAYVTDGVGGVFTIGTDGTGPTALYSQATTTSYGIAAIPPPTYTVTYNGNGNTGGGAPTDPSSPYLTGSTVTVLGNTGGLTRTGYQFQTWNERSDGLGANRAPGSTFTISQDTPLYARWVGGPLEYRTDPAGPAVDSVAFPATIAGQTSSLTLYVRNVGAPVYTNLPTSPTYAITRGPVDPCPFSPSAIQTYNGTTVPDCRYTLTWTAGVPLGSVFSLSYGLTNSIPVTGQVLAAPRTPTFDTPVPTVDGFTVNVTNWDGSWTWTPTAGAGTVTAGMPSGSILPLVVTGLAPDQASTITVTTERTGYAAGSGAVTGSALAAPPAPVEPDTPQIILAPGQRIPVQPGNTVRVPVACPGPQACAVTGAVVTRVRQRTGRKPTTRTIALGWSNRVTVRAGARRVIIVRLSPKRLLIFRTSKRRTVNATVVVRGAGGTASRTSVRLVLPRAVPVTG